MSAEMTKAQGGNPEPSERHAQPQGSAIPKKCQQEFDTDLQAAQVLAPDQRFSEWIIDGNAYEIPAASEGSPYESISFEVLDIAQAHKCLGDLWLYVRLSQYVRAPQGQLTAEPVSTEALAENSGRDKRTIQRALNRLEKAGLVVKVETRQRATWGNTKQGGNAYLLAYRMPRKREALPMSVTTAEAVKVKGAQRIAPSSSNRRGSKATEAQLDYLRQLLSKAASEDDLVKSKQEEPGATKARYERGILGIVAKAYGETHSRLEDLSRAQASEMIALLETGLRIIGRFHGWLKSAHNSASREEILSDSREQDFQIWSIAVALGEMTPDTDFAFEIEQASSVNTEAAKVTVTYTTSDANGAKNVSQSVKSDSLKVIGINKLETDRTISTTRSRASAEQVSFLSSLLRKFSPLASAVVCDLKGVSAISELSNPEALALISALNGERPETLNALREEIERREEQAKRDRQAKSEAYHAELEATRSPMPSTLKAVIEATKQGKALDVALLSAISDH